MHMIIHVIQLSLYHHERTNIIQLFTLIHCQMCFDDDHDHAYAYMQRACVCAYDMNSCAYICG